MSLEEQRVFCEFCGEELEYKAGFAIEHFKKYPSHRGFRTQPK